MLKAALKLLKRLEENGYEAYIVGGFVRDYILDMESIDVDIATNATPKEIKEIFNNIMLPKEEYGSVTLIFNSKRFEITTYRREIAYFNNRKPVEIEYINDLTEDLFRRDFTINTLCMNSNGQIIDKLNGREDIDNKIINTVGDSDYKFQQDSLRMLRAIRFATILNFKLSDDVTCAIIRNKDNLRTLSYNRKRQELDKIFSSTNAKYGVSLLLELGLDEILEIYNLKDIKLDNDLIGVWSSLNISDKYPFNNHEKEIISKVKEVANQALSNLTLYKYGLYICQLAASINGIDKSIITKMYDQLPIISRKDINVSSIQIKGMLNKNISKDFRNIYTDLENKILNGTIENNYDKIREYLVINYS